MPALRLEPGKSALYPIVDADTLERYGITPVDFARAVLEARPPILQLRAKSQAPRQVLEWLRALRSLCDATGTQLFANDRVDLALLARCDGVHVGQRDLPVETVRRIAPALLVGISTHDAAQLSTALSQRPDYVAFGPVFATLSKRNPDPLVGFAGLEEAARRAASAAVPLVGIGGIHLEHAPEVAAIGVHPAVIGGLLPAGASPLFAAHEASARSEWLDAVLRCARDWHDALAVRPDADR